MSHPEIPYQIIRSSRKTLALEITPEGRVLARAPRSMPEEAIRSFIRQKEDWLRKHLEKYENRPAEDKLTHAQLRQLGEEALAWFPDRVKYWASRAGVTYGGITIRAQRSRWGSCSSRGNLNFNCLLMLAAPEIRDYIIVHELCHRKEMNHSPKFWAEVEGVLPDYRGRLQWLKDNGSSLLARLPE